MNSRFPIRTLLLAGMAIVTVGLLASIALRYQGHEAVKTEAPASSGADLRLDQIDYTETRNGKPYWSLQADSADHRIADGVSRVENIRLTVYNQGELGDLHLTARQGRWQDPPGLLEVSGDVVVKSANGYTCYADQMVYSKQQQTLTTDGPVRLVGNGIDIKGVGMDMDVVSRKVALRSAVHSLWQPTPRQEQGS